MKKASSVLSLLVLMLVSFSLVASAGFSVTAKPVGGFLTGPESLLFGEMFGLLTPNAEAELAYSFSSFEVYAGYNLFRFEEDDGDEDVLAFSTVTVGGRYYLAQGQVDPYLFGSIGFFSARNDYDTVNGNVYKAGLGAAYNVSEQWALVAEFGYGSFALEEDVTEIETLSELFSSLGVKYSI